MNIVIVGDGKVGYALSEQLGLEGHDVTIIDNNLKALNETVEALDVMGVHGNGARRDVQIDAGVPDADLLVAATSTDELNMLCCLMAKHLGAENTIARIRNPEYMPQLHMLKEQFGLSMIINPELATASAIDRILRFPSAIKVDTFAKGRVELVEFKLPDNCPLIGKRLMDITFKPQSSVLICAVERRGEVVIPNGGFALERGDKIHITGENRTITAFLSEIGGLRNRIRSIIIVGGGRMAYYLAKMLDDKSFQIKLIEKKIERCNELCELLPRVTVIHGDGSDLGVLESEGIDDVDAFVALTDMDEENPIMSMLAGQRKVSKVVTKINRTNYMPIIEKMDLDTVVSPKVLTADEITSYVRAMQNTVGSSKVDTLYKLVGGKAEALEFTVTEGARYLETTLRELPLKRNLLVGVIVRGGHVIIPHGQDCIRAGDSVIIITNQHKLADLNDIFEH